MSLHIEFQYRFHAAGQGIFASGTLKNPETCKEFHWVFDCGSTASTKVLKPKVIRYRDMILGDRLDLLCISHFDNDHVSGLTHLLKGLDVGTIVIPYLSPLERLVLGARSDVAGGGYFSFLADPVSFLINRSDSIDRIILVGGNTPDGPGRHPLPGPPPSQSPFERDPGDSWILKPDLRLTWAPISFLDLATLQVAEKKNTELVISQDSFGAFARAVSHQIAWEFKFFHKPIEPTVRTKIRKAVAACFTNKAIPTNASSILSALTSPSMRKKINVAFSSALAGSSTDDINSTSLCVYSGPDLNGFGGSDISPPWPNPLLGANPVDHHYHDYWHSGCSILYTGDADLSTKSNRDELRTFLGDQCWQHIAILQVPHHGSRKNWKIGSVDEFSHRHSVFCADEHYLKYGHPHREVVLDLLHRGPILANKETGWAWRGIACFQ